MKTAMEKLLALAIAFVVAAPLAADEGDEVKLPPQAKVIDDSIQKLSLNEEQQSKYQKIYEQHVPVLQKQYEQQEQIYTPEQKEKRKVAKTKAKEEGLKGKEFEQFVQSQVQFTPEQQKQYTESQTELGLQQSKFREEVYQILTPDQQEKFPKFGKGKDKVKGKDKPKPQTQIEPKQGKPEPKEQPK